MIELNRMGDNLELQQRASRWLGSLGLFAVIAVSSYINCHEC